ncbi:hypothetical protein [Polaromonas sp. YR568]|uniref:hypothetical protein n=1 Tax=Polaromonas sp. YR568 TaxID=1855301 RepID=UPI003137C1D9
MPIKLFDLFVRNHDQSYLVDRHQSLVNRLIEAIKNLLAAPEIISSLTVRTSIQDGGELLEFSLNAKAQMDFFRMDTEDASQLEQEAKEVRDTLRPKFEALNELARELRLTPARFWEILESRGFKSDMMELIRVASKLNLKAIRLRTAQNDQCYVDLDHLLKTATRQTPVELRLIVKLVASNHAFCKIMRSDELRHLGTRRQIKLVWPRHKSELDIAQRLLAGSERRRPVVVNAFPVLDLAGDVCGLELERFAEARPRKCAKTKNRHSADWFSGADWPMPK